MTIINPIFVGFAWEQSFTIDPLMTPVGSTLRIRLHQWGQSPAAPLDVTCTHPVPGTHVLTLSEAETASLKAPGHVSGDFVIEQPGFPDRPLNLRITIAVEQSLTPASP